MSEVRTNDSYDAHRLLRGLELFRHLDAATLDELARELEWFALPGGATLFEYGDPSDALCVLKSGSLGAFKPAQDGSFQLDGVVAAGETVGELGLIVDAPRSATVRALRDSELLRLPRSGFEKLVARHPQAMLVSAQAEPSSTWNTPLVTWTVAWVSCHRQLAVLVQAVVIVGEAVL